MTTNSQSADKLMTRLGALFSVAAVGLAFSMQANAPDDSIFEEIVVTVQKREQNIMDVPGRGHRTDWR